MLWQTRAWYQAGMLEQSEASCAKILAVEPNHIDAIYLLRALQSGTSRWPEALADFDRVLALRADFPEALANRSVAPERLVEAADSLDNLRASEHVRWHWQAPRTSVSQM
jgi:tetratricopeptide (TPR) repeat protein